MATRREVLAVAAATISFPMLESALGTLRSARAQAATAPATAPSTAPATSPATAPGRGMRGASRTAPNEKPGWFATTIKPADVKADEFTDVPDHVIALTRTGKDISAVTTKCTHEGCKIIPKAGAKTITCPCHQAQFNLDGSVAKAPARTPLAHYAVRLNDAGLIEIDPGQKPAAEDKEFKITVA